MTTPLEKEIGLVCELPECGRRDFLPTRCDLCNKVVCHDHVEFHGCDGKRAARKHVGSSEPDQKLFKCSVAGCHEAELIRIVCKSCGKQVCLPHRSPKTHACRTVAAKTSAKTTTSNVSVSAKPAPSKPAGAVASSIVVAVQFSDRREPASVSLPATATAGDLVAAVKRTLSPEESARPFRVRFHRAFLQDDSVRLSELEFGNRATVVVHWESDADIDRPPTEADSTCLLL
jgi:hypothetical protein